MKAKHLSVNRLFRWICIGVLLSMAAISFILFAVTLERAVLLTGIALTEGVKFSVSMGKNLL